MSKHFYQLDCTV